MNDLIIKDLLTLPEELIMNYFNEYSFQKN